MKSTCAGRLAKILLVTLPLACCAEYVSDETGNHSDETDETGSDFGPGDTATSLETDTDDGNETDKGTETLDVDTATHSNDEVSPEITKFNGIDNLLLRGTVVTPFTAFDGEILTVGNEIQCVDTDCSQHKEAMDATVIETHGIIYPGMIDAHNHIMYDVFDEDDWSPDQLFDHHNQWLTHEGYQSMKDCYDYLLASEAQDGVNLDCEVLKYGEIKGLIAGTTSILGAPKGSPQLCFQSLARSIDGRYNDLPETARDEPCTAAPSTDHIQTAISLPSNGVLTSLLENFDDCSTWSYVVHVGEGISSSVAYNEWASMKEKKLDVFQSTVVHGTAFAKDDFEHMAANGMKLVWSPRSNIFLYNATTRIDLALSTATPLTIALAPDWSLGGSANLMDELRFAYEYDQDSWGGVLAPEDLVEMVTINAAKALEIDLFLGSLETGKLADLFVISGDRARPYETLVHGSPLDVRLVMVDGKILYGDRSIEATAAFAECEQISVCGTDRFLCVAEPNTNYKLDQTLEDIVNAIQGALLDYDDANGTNFYPVAPYVNCP